MSVDSYERQRYSVIVKLIVAHDDARGIGRRADMPWHIPGEAKWTSRITRAARPGVRNALIMGRTTYFSIPEKRRPLVDRINIVVSSRASDLGAGVHVASSLVDALRLAAGIEGVGDVFIFGGAVIYRQALELRAAEELLISVVPGDYQCDTFFPELPSAYSLESSAVVQYGDVEVRHDHYRRS